MRYKSCPFVTFLCFKLCSFLLKKKKIKKFEFGMPFKCNGGMCTLKENKPIMYWHNLHCTSTLTAYSDIQCPDVRALIWVTSWSCALLTVVVRTGLAYPRYLRWQTQMCLFLYELALQLAIYKALSPTICVREYNFRFGIYKRTMSGKDVIVHSRIIGTL